MHPVFCDGTRLLVIDGVIGQKKTKVLIEGIGHYDGNIFIILSDNNEQFQIPETLWHLTEIPLTGKWKTMYPMSDFYIEIS